MAAISPEKKISTADKLYDLERCIAIGSGVASKSRPSGHKNCVFACNKWADIYEYCFENLYENFNRTDW